jgi:histidine ammonia-lyase
LTETIAVGPEGLTIEQVVRLAEGTAVPALLEDPQYLAFVARGAEHLARRLAGGQVVYGVTTGFGEDCETMVRRSSRGRCRST